MKIRPTFPNGFTTMLALPAWKLYLWTYVYKNRTGPEVIAYMVCNEVYEKFLKFLYSNTDCTHAHQCNVVTLLNIYSSFKYWCPGKQNPVTTLSQQGPGPIQATGV